MKLPMGLHIYALGKDVKKAYASGINVAALRFFVHTFAGLAAGIAGICISANICAGSPTVGSAMSMNSIAAAVIGGVSSEWRNWRNLGWNISGHHSSAF